MLNQPVRQIAGALVLVCLSPLAAGQTSGRVAVEPEPQWRFDSGSPIYGDSSVTDSAVYFANTGGTVYALDKDSGGVLWRYRSDGAVYSGVSVGEDGVYFLSDDGFTYKLDAETGALHWRAATPSDVKRNPVLTNNSNWDYNSSTPMERAGQVYLGSGNGTVYALDADTGDTLWQFDAGASIRTEPAVAGDFVIVGDFGGILYCLDRHSGETVWQYDTRTDLDDTPRDYTINSPASVFGDKVYIGTRSTYLFALDLATGRMVWNYPYVSSWAESPISFYDGTVYAGSSFLRAQFAFDAEDGTLRWMHNRTHGLSYSRLEPTEEALYVGTVAVPGLQYEGFLTDGGLLKLNRFTGESEWFYRMPENPHLTEFGVISSPVFDEGRIYFGSLDGVFYSLEEVAYEFPILEFSAERDELKYGEKTILHWHVIDNHVVRLNGKRVPNRGHRVVRAKSDKLYTLSVDGRLQEEQQILLEVKPASGINLAKFGSASASSTEDPVEYAAEFAIDGDMRTRWASTFEDGQSITFDLGDCYALDRIVIHWEGAYASTHRIEASDDREHWVPIYETAGNQGGLNEITGLETEARYLRLTGDVRSSPYGVSIYEFEVYERETARRCKSKGRHDKKSRH